ncbi:MAG: thymidine phosphorylase [Clostridiales bacterium]|nr:thymidine phosphorylase [Clostridiales bacterium]
MNIIDIIEKKKKAISLNRAEIDFFIKGIVSGQVKDYQASALLMAICINGMDKEETFYLTDSILNSGDKVDLKGIKGITADKHSTGGVGDSTTFVVAPALAAYGIKCAKMSGRGLGFTGGTLDKLESFDGIDINLTPARFIKQVNEIGIAVTGQSASLCPADKILYALRDVTGTVDSLPLIASSIMSKKLAVGADIIVLDVKTGDGSLMGSYNRSFELAQAMVEIGKAAGKKAAAVITSMDEPLDSYIGNSLEIKGAIETLEGERNLLFEVSKKLFALTLELAGVSGDEAEKAFYKVIDDGFALKKFYEMLKAQGVKDFTLKEAERKTVVEADVDGYVSKVAARKLGLTVMRMGGGRTVATDTIDHTVGIKILKRAGDKVIKGEPLAIIYHNKKEIDEVIKDTKEAFNIDSDKTQPNKLIYGVVK